MKIDFYFDWFPGMDLKYAAANATPICPCAPIPGAKRYRFTVDVDDPNEPASAQEVTATSA